MKVCRDKKDGMKEIRHLCTYKTLKVTIRQLTKRKKQKDITVRYKIVIEKIESEEKRKKGKEKKELDRKKQRNRRKKEINKQKDIKIQDTNKKTLKVRVKW